MSERTYWLCKSEPDNYSIDELEADKVTPWDGVRNYGARNYMRDGMNIGDLCFFYHSNHNSLQISSIPNVKVFFKDERREWSILAPHCGQPRQE